MCQYNFYGIRNSKNGGSTEAQDLNHIERILYVTSIVVNHKKIEMDNDYFWKHVRKKKNVGSEKDFQKEMVPLTEHELKLHNQLCVDIVIDEDACALEIEEYDDDDISVVSSCIGSKSGHANIDIEDHETTESPEDLEQWKNLTA